MGMFFRLLCLLLMFSNSALVSSQNIDDGTNASQNQLGYLDVPVESKFLDTLNTDSLRALLIAPLKIHIPREKVNAIIDPYDALNNELYAQKSTSKIWFFIAFFIAVLGFSLYIQNFPSQFVLRLQSTLNPQKYKELLSEKKSRVMNGSIYLLLLSSLVQSLVYSLLMLRLRYFELNNASFFILLLLSLIVVKSSILGIQFVQAKVLDLQDAQQNMTQRHINVELVFSLILLPISLFYYYNPQFLFGISEIWFILFCCIPLILRYLVQLYGIIQDSAFNVQVLLYFCTLEFLPMVLIATIIIQRLYAEG